MSETVSARIPARWEDLTYGSRLFVADIQVACAVGRMDGVWTWTIFTDDDQLVGGTAPTRAKAKRAVVARLKEAVCQR